MKQRILIAYAMDSAFTQTTVDYLNAFREHLDAQVEYLHVTNNADVVVSLEEFDVVIQSYCARLCFDGYVSNTFIKQMRRYRGLKVLIVQDEYNHTNILKRAIKTIHYNVVLTCVPQDSLEYVYPKKEFPDVRFETVFTGYVPDHLVHSNLSMKPVQDRHIVVGYRGRDIGGLYGRLGFDKYEIGRRMREICQQRGIPHDIAMDEDSRIYGSAWLEFVGSCRSMLGSESGSNVFDFDGTIEREFNEMTSKLGHRPSYEEFLPRVAKRDSEISMGQISPRVFECALMRTPMVLFRGRYSDAIQPDVHYIALEKDFSNVETVLRRLEQFDEIEAMATRAYDDLVGSGKFGYRAYMQRLAGIIDVERNVRAVVRPGVSKTNCIKQSSLQGAYDWRFSLPTKRPGAASYYHLIERKKLFIICRDEIERMERLMESSRSIQNFQDACKRARLSEKKPGINISNLEIELKNMASRLRELPSERSVVSELALRFESIENVKEMDKLIQVYQRQRSALYGMFNKLEEINNVLKTGVGPDACIGGLAVYVGRLRRIASKVKRKILASF